MGCSLRGLTASLSVRVLSVECNCPETFCGRIMFVLNAPGSFPESMRMGSGDSSALQTDNDDQSRAVECDDAQGRSNNAQRTEVIIFRF